MDKGRNPRKRERISYNDGNGNNQFLSSASSKPSSVANDSKSRYGHSDSRNNIRLDHSYKEQRKRGDHFFEESYAHDSYEHNYNTNSHRRHHKPKRQDSFGAVQKCIHTPSGSGPQISVEGWVVIVTGCHDEAQEEDIRDVFSEFGRLKNISLGMDRRTGFCKGYALVELEKKSEAQDAINALHGSKLLGKTIHVDWAFVGSASDNFNERPQKKLKRI